MEEVCGYDAIFDEEVADHFKCVICHMVLKHPLQLAECGHRFCSDCFERWKSSVQRDQLSCPFDRRDIDVDKVFEDKGIERIILDLKVKCNHVRKGCFWSGDLRDLEKHLAEDCLLAGGELSSTSIIQQLEGKVDMVNNAISCAFMDFEQKYQELSQMNQQLQKRYDRFVSKKQKLMQNVQNDIHNLKNDLNALQSTNNTLKEQVHNIHEKLGELQNMDYNNSSDGELERTNNVMQDFETAFVRDLQRKVDEISVQINTIKGNKNELNTEINNFQVKDDEIKREMGREFMEKMERETKKYIERVDMFEERMHRRIKELESQRKDDCKIAYLLFFISVGVSLICCFRS